MNYSLLTLLALLPALLASPIEQKNADDYLSERHLIKLGPKQRPKWMQYRDVLKLIKNDVGFFDVTDSFTGAEEEAAGEPTTQVPIPAVPKTLSQKMLVRAILRNANADLMKRLIKDMTAFHTRYYKAPTGTQSADWLFEATKKVVQENNVAGLDVSVKQFAHSFTSQQSVIVRIEGQRGNEETVIMGAHQDSINTEDPMNGRAPGADDDASGVVTQMEILRLILSNAFIPARPIEFHFYSAEEDGLKGSQDIANTYLAQGRVVAGMFQLDMTGYNQPADDIGIEVDFVNPTLTNFLRQVVTEYAGKPNKDFKCGYGCSDFASWDKVGYPAARPGETSVRPLPNRVNMHSPRDTVETLSFEHMLEFVKIGVGFVVELAAFQF